MLWGTHLCYSAHLHYNVNVIAVIDVGGENGVAR